MLNNNNKGEDLREGLPGKTTRQSCILDKTRLVRICLVIKRSRKRYGFQATSNAQVHYGSHLLWILRKEHVIFQV